MERRGERRITGHKALAATGAIFIAELVAACGGDKPQATQTPVLPTEQPTPTVMITPSPEVTPEPTVNPTPEATPATIHLADGAAYLDGFTEWKKTNTDPVVATTLQNGIKDFLNSALKSATYPKIESLYNALIGENLLEIDLKAITAKNSSGQDFLSSCSDLVSDMAYANNGGLVGALEYGYQTQALCESIAKKRGIPLHNSTGTGLNDIIKTNLDALLG